MTVSERLSKLVKESGHSQGWIAEQAGVSGANLSLILNGHRKDPRGSTLSKLAKVLGVTVDDMLNGSVGQVGVPDSKYIATCIRCGSERRLVLIPHYHPENWVSVKFKEKRMVGWIFSCEGCLGHIVDGEVSIKYHEIGKG